MRRADIDAVRIAAPARQEIRPLGDTTVQEAHRGGVGVGNTLPDRYDHRRDRRTRDGARFEITIPDVGCPSI